MQSKLIAGLALFLIVGGVFVFTQNRQGNEVEIPTACTMDARICPDGSAVGRVAPNCEFAACPNEVVGGGGAGILPYKSGIEGVVSRGPICPVVRDDEECPDSPYETEVVMYRSAPTKEIFATGRSDKEGRFVFNIPPGDYVANAVNDGISKTCEDVPVTVGPDAMVHIAISCDTGIR